MERCGGFVPLADVSFMWHYYRQERGWVLPLVDGIGGGGVGRAGL